MPDHVPVLLPAVLDGLHLTPDSNVIDATLGGGGHTRAMLDVIAPRGRCIGIEADQRTLENTVAALRTYGDRFVSVHGNFRDLQALVAPYGSNGFAAILFDLGVSSMTIGDATRGFSFQADGPLDMRFDPTTQALTAADIVNTWSVSELMRIFTEYGDEHLSQRIAQHLMTRRPFHRTIELADAVSEVKHRRGRTHPATQVFQALRITVNDEYGAITSALPQALALLAPGGRLAVITFHSGEDRLVKYWMKSLSAEQVTINTKHVIVPPRDEQLANPRSRSAKLRILTKK